MQNELDADTTLSYRPLGRMPIFRPGTVAYLNGRQTTVSHVLISRGQLFVHVDGQTNPVPCELLEIEPSTRTWPADRLLAARQKPSPNRVERQPA